MVAKPIRKKTVAEALRILEGIKKRAAVDVRKVLLSAMANAENNLGLDIDKLKIIEASVGKSLVLRRTDIKARSRMGRITKPFSQIRVVLEQASSSD